MQQVSKISLDGVDQNYLSMKIKNVLFLQSDI